jgi:nicotinate-nucleotide pyrophosphorylase (carboxylating)
MWGSFYPSPMHPADALPSEVHSLIAMALAEDIGPGDLTAKYFLPQGATSHGRMLVKQAGVIAGLDVAAEVFRQVDDGIEITLLANDGDRVQKGDIVMELRGPTDSLLTAERTALNFLQRLSGVASKTRSYVDALEGTQTKLLDTRKTTPGWRWLEKRAVRSGGGVNHRMGLYDMVMVKDNHLLAEDGQNALQAAIDLAKREHTGLKVVVEADRVAQVQRFLQLRGVNRILLDNMSLEDMRECVRLAGGKLPLEASGGVTLERLPAIAATGVDFISCGAVTHSAVALDISLDLL